MLDQGVKLFDRSAGAFPVDNVALRPEPWQGENPNARANLCQGHRGSIKINPAVRIIVGQDDDIGPRRVAA